MVRRLALAVLAVSVAAGVATAVRARRLGDDPRPIHLKPIAGTYDVDPARTSFVVEAEHLGVARIEGRFDDVSGVVVFDPKHLRTSSITLRVGVASLDTGVAARDARLRTAEFFDAPLYPEILFVSRNVFKGGRSYIADGDLTIRGVTKSVRLLFNAYGAAAPKGTAPAPRMGLEARPLAIDRRDYGIRYDTRLPNGTPVVGDAVEARLSLEAVRKG